MIHNINFNKCTNIGRQYVTLLVNASSRSSQLHGGGYKESE